MNTIAFVRQESNWVETGFSTWVQLLLTVCAGKAGLEVVDVCSTELSRESVEDAVKGAKLIVFSMHGQKDQLGSPNAIVDSGNVACLKGAIVVALSCEAGDQLGAKAIASGARAFMGFTGLLVNFHPQPGLFTYPWLMAIKPFVMEGKSIGSVKEALETHLQQMERQYFSGRGKSDHNSAIVWMAARTNWRGLVLHGDDLATI